MKKVKIKGYIISDEDAWIYDWFGMDYTSPKSVEDVIKDANGDDVEVEINSPGGNVFAGSEIYTTLKSYTGNVNGKIVGIAASAASVIAMACKKVSISPTAEIMIHNVSSRVSGDHRVFEHEAQVLKDYNSTIANAYMIKTGMKKEDLLELMNKETYLTPEKALELKFVDEILFMNQIQLVASQGGLPQEVIDKMKLLKNELLKNNPANKSDFFIPKMQAQLDLLNLGGILNV